MAFVLMKQFRFEAAHFLPKVPPGHPCGKIHGHSVRVEVSVRGEADPESGWVLDYGEMSRAVRPVIETLDHALLNSVPGLANPTSENLCLWLWSRLVDRLPGLFRVSVLETCQTRCDYEGPPG